MDRSVIGKLLNKNPSDVLFHGITTGRVTSTDDPQQMGRLRVYIPILDDQDDEDVPWAFYGSPFSGIVEDMPRGRSGNPTVGPVAYGMWAIPKVGAHVLIMCINGNPEQRVWLGCIPIHLLNHTTPHGRHIEDETSGPLSSNDSPIEPLYSAQLEAFNSELADVDPLMSEEYKTRGADRSTSMVDNELLPVQEFATRADDAGGYQENRVPNTEGLDSNIYGLTTPGFHSISMDDNETSCRIRIRTTAGQQIIFDDSNERIYLSTAQGKTWIEFDEKGTIDMYAEHDVSIRSQADVNIISDQTIRLAGKEGVHISSENEIRLHCGEDMSIRTDANLRIKTGEDLLVESVGTTHHRSNATRIHGNTIFIEADQALNIKSPVVEIGDTINISGPVGIEGVLDVTGAIASGVDVTTPSHSLNLHTHTYILPRRPEIPPLQPGITTPQLLPTGSTASASANPQPAEEEESNAQTAYFPSRAPQHEPWARTYLDIAVTDVDEDGALVVFQGITLDPDSVSEHTYTDSAVGRVSPARSKDFFRNDNWRR